MAGEQQHNGDPSTNGEQVSKLILQYGLGAGCRADPEHVMGALNEAQRNLQARNIGNVSVLPTQNGGYFMVTGAASLETALSPSVETVDAAIDRKMVGYEIIGALWLAAAPDLAAPDTWNKLLKDPSVNITEQALEISRTARGGRLDQGFSAFIAELGLASPGRE